MEASSRKRWPRPRFTIAALLVLITLCAPFLAYLSLIRRGNEQRQAAFDAAVSKGMRLEPSQTAPASATPITEAAGARELWSTLLGNPKIPNFARVQIHDFFGKNRPRPPISDADLKSLEHLPEIEDFHFYYSKDVTDEGLSVLGKLPRLKRIMLNDMRLVTGEFLAQFPEDNVVESIWIVDLKGMDGSKLADLRHFKNLKQLLIFNVPLLESDAMVGVSLPPGVTDLQLVGVNLSDKTISRWLSQVQLERLEVRAPISKVAVEELAKQTNLTILKVSNARLNDEDFRFLRNLDRLKSLHLNGMPVRGDLLDFVASPEGLTSVGFNSTLFTDENLRKLSQFPNLDHLDLAWTPISGEGFAAEIRWPLLKQVWLSGTRFSESGKAAFAKLPELREVHMPGNWTFEDLERFRINGPKFSPTINGYFVRPEASQDRGQVFTYLPTINMPILDDAASEVMKPVVGLHALGLAEREEWDRRTEPKP